MNEPAITVAVPTCNGARHLRAALRSILAQDTPHDLIVVDDRSNDETVAIARAEGGDRVRIEVNSERLGLAGNWNRCVALSTTPQVAIFHQDDVMLPGHLATHVAAYRANPSFGWVASHTEVIDDTGRPVPESVVERGGLGPVDRGLDAEDNGEDDATASSLCFVAPELTVGNPLRCSAMTISREAHAAVGGFDPSYRYVVDWDYWVRVANCRPVAWRAATTVTIRWHPASETHRFATGTADLDETARLLEQIDRQIEQPCEDPADWARKAYRRLARAYLNRAYTAARAGRPDLSRRALVAALQTDRPGTIKSLARDPRLVARLALSIVRPGRVNHG